MRIFVELSDPTAGLTCCREHCPFKGSCSNHESASSSRKEEGFSPLLFEENGQFYCGTCDEKPERPNSYPKATMGVGQVALNDNFDFVYPHFEVNNV